MVETRLAALQTTFVSFALHVAFVVIVVALFHGRNPPRGAVVYIYFRLTLYIVVVT